MRPIESDEVISWATGHQATAVPVIDFDPDLLSTVCGRLGIRLLVLFGSRARGQPFPVRESDADLAVSGDRLDVMECHRVLSEVFAGYSLDLVSLDRADSLFRYEIMSTGILLYGDPDLFCEYRAYAYRDFVDSADLRELEDKLFRKKMAFIRRALHASP